MKISSVVTVAVAAGLLMTGAAAQHEEHHQDQATQQPGTSAPPKEAKGMSSNVMSQMPMMMGQNETAKLVDQLLESFTAIEAEKDPAALKERLAAHGALLKGLQTKAQAQSHMMDMMQHMMCGSMMGAEPKK